MITGINHITLTTKDIKKSFDFYKNVLNFKPLCKWNNGAYFLVGNTWFCLNYDINTLATNDYTHIAFDVAQDKFEFIKNKIIEHGSIIFKENKSEGDSLYFYDIDGHKLEIDVGNWQTRIAEKKHDLGNWKSVEFFV